MASGDAQRVWFPELLEALTAAWSPGMPWEELAALLERLTEQRKTLRQERGILAPLTTCRTCGTASRADISGISIRSALFALEKSGVLSREDREQLDARWRKHQAAGRLDAYGRERVAGSTSATCREHPLRDR